jgi:hypothetical protein
MHLEWHIRQPAITVETQSSTPAPFVLITIPLHTPSGVQSEAMPTKKASSCLVRLQHAFNHMQRRTRIAIARPRSMACTSEDVQAKKVDGLAGWEDCSEETLATG